MTWLVVAVGLLLLVFLHELGHFSVALARRHPPALFYVGFPPALVKVKRKGIEYGIGAIPLGGSSGSRACTGRRRTTSTRSWRRRCAKTLRSSPIVQRVRRPLEAERLRRARAPRCPSCERDRSTRELSAGARRAANRALREIDEGTGDDAYWRAADVEAHRRDRSRARSRTSSSRSSSSSSSSRPARRRAPRRHAVGEVEANTPAAAAGLRPATRSSP